MTQSLLTIFVPTLMVLIGILLNRGDAARLDARITGLENRLDARLSKMDDRMSALEGRLHADMMQVIGKLTELEMRVARLEQER